MMRIQDLLLRDGSEGSYDAVRRYATRWAEARSKDRGAGVEAFIPLLFRQGEAYQFDWSHEDVKISRKPMLVMVAHARYQSDNTAIASFALDAEPRAGDQREDGSEWRNPATVEDLKTEPKAPHQRT